MFVFEKEKESEKRLIYVGYLKSKQCDCILSSLPVNVFFLRVLLTKGHYDKNMELEHTQFLSYFSVGKTKWKK